MISNQIIQNIIDGIKGISRVDLFVADTTGDFVAHTADTTDEMSDVIVEFAESNAESQEVQPYQLFKIYDDAQVELILVAQGAGDDVFMVGKMATFQIQNLLVAYKERFDKDNFVKNLLLDNMLLVDIYNRASKLEIDTDARRSVCIIETTGGKDSVSVETIKNMFEKDSQDIITTVDEKNIILIKELKDDEDYDTLEEVAQTIVDMLASEAMTSAIVSYGTIVNEIKEVSRSYKEAKMAQDVGKIFFSDKQVVAYNNLGIGRLIYQLPLPLCKLFIQEIFKDQSPSDFDDETLTTIDKFFENNLNISETSRQLYIHRNTLVYRLDKIQKMTGLDLRVFDDAITLKIALMVVKYMEYIDHLE